MPRGGHAAAPTAVGSPPPVAVSGRARPALRLSETARARSVLEEGDLGHAVTYVHRPVAGGVDALPEPVRGVVADLAAELGTDPDVPVGGGGEPPGVVDEGPVVLDPGPGHVDRGPRAQAVQLEDRVRHHPVRRARNHHRQADLPVQTVLVGVLDGELDVRGRTGGDDQLAVHADAGNQGHVVLSWRDADLLLAVVDGFRAVVVAVDAADRVAVGVLLKLCAGDPSPTGPGVGLPPPLRAPAVQRPLHRPVAAVDPHLVPPEHRGGAVQVGVDRALLTGGGVPVDGVVDRTVVGHPAVPRLGPRVPRVRRAAREAGQRTLGGGLPHDDDPDPRVGQLARLGRGEILAGAVGQVPADELDPRGLQRGHAGPPERVVDPLRHRDSPPMRRARRSRHSSTRRATGRERRSDPAEASVKQPSIFVVTAFTRLYRLVDFVLAVLWASLPETHDNAADQRLWWPRRQWGAERPPPRRVLEPATLRRRSRARSDDAAGHATAACVPAPSPWPAASPYGRCVVIPTGRAGSRRPAAGR